MAASRGLPNGAGRPLPARFPARVVGGSFNPGYPGSWYRAVGERAPLSLLRQPDNPADPQAVAVVRDDTGMVLGHLRRHVASRLAAELDDGVLWVVIEAIPAFDDRAMDHPGLTVRLERIAWADDPPVRTGQLGSPPATSGSGLCRVDPRAYAQRMVDRGGRQLAAQVREVAPDLWAVPSSSQPGRSYAVVVDVDDHRLVRCLCHCGSGTFRPQLPVPCRHAAAVISHLAAAGTVRIVDGLGYHLPSLAPTTSRSVPMGKP